ncbi:inositol monophosphatase family protein [Kozakia baliensis]|uniref:Inositol-1-monophosphatase n=1 Tax=Kozakia baliensis TaxID=153496 RepID=A0A1D8UUB6_9PROT|nr:inositol monophosphatase family protein [Kozakia baliensis]AOX17232.1 inositol monophosphatase [Kozakia baliensis]AOX20111.1 inositol monophosphatase [Kozakia baliensis]GBR29722.1 inositol-1-monophosphatase [Kozakia baliensis NRIC 0488]GEL63351.1 inositol monophosphatase [Kozakia baliensis]
MTDPRLIAQRLEVARSVVHDAAALAMAMRPPPGGPTGTIKGMQDYLTEADGAVEKLISNRMQALYPEDGFMGEEGGKHRQGALTWVVDPIDGTSNYARGRDRWCVSLGLMDGDVPVAGVLHAPALGEVYTAQRGHGAFLNGKPIKASPVSDTRTAMVEMGWSARVTTETYTERFSAFMALGVMPRSGGSGALALADVATGRLDAYLEMVINLWDVAAALVLLHEAGAKVSPFLQNGGLTGGATIFAAAPGVAAPLAEAAQVSFS